MSYPVNHEKAIAAVACDRFERPFSCRQRRICPDLDADQRTDQPLVVGLFLGGWQQTGGGDWSEHLHLDQFRSHLDVK